MKKKIKIVFITIIISIICLLSFHFLYVVPIRENAIDYIRNQYYESLEVLRKEYNLDELSESTVDDYYLAIREVHDNKFIAFEVQNELLAFFTTYREYFSFNMLKSRYN